MSESKNNNNAGRIVNFAGGVLALLTPVVLVAAIVLEHRNDERYLQKTAYESWQLDVKQSNLDNTKLSGSVVELQSNLLALDKQVSATVEQLAALNAVMNEMIQKDSEAQQELLLVENKVALHHERKDLHMTPSELQEYFVTRPEFEAHKTLIETEFKHMHQTQTKDKQ